MSFKKAFAGRQVQRRYLKASRRGSGRTCACAVAPNGAEFYTDSLDRLRFGNTKLIPEFLALMKRESERNDVNIVIGITGFYLELTKHHR
jgi:hypothetical protein